MSVSKDFIAYVVEQLSALPEVSTRRMFGGVGLYADGFFFGLIDDDTLFFKVDDTNRADYVERGSKAFRPYKDKPVLSMNYFDVPADLLEDADELTGWARKSLSVAIAAASQKTIEKKPKARRSPHATTRKKKRKK